MSLATRCPACGTVFRVVQDQLKVSEGWVRCGHCQEVFQGIDALYDLKSEPLMRPRAHRRDGVPASAYGPVVPSRIEGEGEGEGVAAFTEAPSSSLIQDPVAAPSRHFVDSGAPELPVRDEEPVDESVDESIPESTDDGALPENPALVPPPESIADFYTPPAARGASAPARLPRFLREARRNARWSHPGVRAALGVLALLLTLLAGAQAAYPLRDTLAARWPASAPAWAWACRTLGCTVQAPRALASLTLDGSSLTRTEVDRVLLFTAEVRNRADHPVRAPSFDLRFTDDNGQVLARKVFEPRQLGISQPAIAAQGELHLRVRLGVGALNVSGFQAEVFYP